jgi:hypothetical protein
MPEPRLDHQSIKISQLIEDYRSGRMVVPEFQREYVWKKNKAVKLLDSLYRGFPISSLLLWASTEQARAKRSKPRPIYTAPMSWLIDGQQRVMTLSKVMTGDESIDVVFNPEAQEFKLPNAATKNDPRWIRVAEIWHDEDFRRLRRNIPEGSRGLREEARFERVRSILDYEVPVVRMIDHTFDAAAEAFTRINSLGVRLKQQDLESAQIAARHAGFIADKVTPSVERFRAEGLTRINVMHLFRVCAFLAMPDGRTRTPLHKLERKEVEQAWRATEKAVRETMCLVRSELGLVNMDILWSGTLLVPIMALCATRKPSERDANSMIGWLALASLYHRYGVATETALDQDLRACRTNDPMRALLSNLRRPESGLKAMPVDFGSFLNDKGALLGAYIACHHRGLRDLFTGAKIMLQPEVDRHHILPKALFPEERKPEADCLANIAFLSGQTNRHISASSPEIYLRKIKPEILESQCIPLDRDLWSIERADEFWEARRILLADAFNDFLRASLPDRKI